MRKHDTNTVVFLIVADLLITLLAFFTAIQARYRLPFGVQLTWEEVAQPWPIFVLVAIIWSTTFIVLHVYDARTTLRPWPEAQTITWAVAVASLVFAGVLYLTFREVPRRLFVYFALGDVALLVAFRFMLRAALRFAGRAESISRQVLIVGTGQLGRRVAEGLVTVKDTGLTLVGFVGDEPARPGLPQLAAPVLGRIENTPAIVRAHAVDEVIFALPLRAHGVLERLVTALQEQPVRVRVVPDFLDLAMSRATVEEFYGLPLVGLRDPAIDGFDRVVKRIFDLLVTGGMLLLCWPLMLVVAAAIKLDSPGPVFFVQERIGENGQPFAMIKFRSMAHHGEHKPASASARPAGATFLHKRPDDPRVTRVGHFIRRTSLDELPQMFNVLRGEMSLVGPRPELPWLVARYESWQRRRFAVPPGITGWWQINGRSERTMHLHTEDDLYYIQNYSPLLDIKILWRTIGVVVRGRGAF